MFAVRIRRRSIQRWVAAGIVGLISASPACLAQELLVDTGPGSSSGGYSLFNDGSSFNHLGCSVTLTEDFAIGTVTAWMVRPAGTLAVKLRANTTGNLPGAELESSTYNLTFGGFTAQWVGFAVDWSYPAGTYWVTFEPEVGASFGSMPGNAPSPLAKTGFLSDGNPGWIAFAAGDALGRFGLRLYTPEPPEPIFVPGDYPTIQLAIDAAANGDSVEVDPGTYTEAINFGGKTITIRKAVTKLDGDEAIIDASGTNQPAVTIGSGSDSGTVLEGFTIRGGSALAGLGYGGGVLVDGATATIRDCIITQNQADSGGGAAAFSSADATFENCQFIDNAADTSGGGAYVNSATANFIDCTFVDNHTDGSGGGMNVNVGGTADLSGCAFAGNTADNAGGGAMIISSTGSASFAACVWTDNTAVQAGGVAVNGGSADFDECDFIDNHATFVGATSGGGMQVQGAANVTLIACDFLDNDAAYGAGAQFLAFGGSASVTGCSFKNNVASIAGGGVHRGFGGASNPSIGATLFCGNAPENITGTYTDGGSNTLNASCNAPGDANGDGQVNVGDLLAVITAWGACPAPPAACPSDLNGDGQVNVNDLLLVITNWS